MMDKVSRSERNWVFMWAVAIVLLSSLPYLWGAFLAPKGYHFLGLTHNIDDGAVYLSWMRQAADGHFFIRNLFTNEPQTARAFSVLFLLMGAFARITHLPLILVFHLFRIGFGILFIWSIWQFSRLFLEDERQRKILIPLIGLSAGIGWLIPGAGAPTGPVDLWQPEAITFLSTYLNPLFLAGLILMIWSFYFLLKMQRTGRVGDAAIAGVMLLLLGNIHTYDVITVGCLWAVYVIVSCATTHKIQLKTIAFSAISAVIALPSVAYQYYIYKIDPVYAARVNSPTPSPEIWSFFAGYGFVLIGAVIGVVLIIRSKRCKGEVSPLSVLHYPLLIVWSVIGFALPYIPVAQQRKLIMGLHIPLCILCAIALCKLIESIPGAFRSSVLLLIVSLMSISNFKFIAQDMRLLTQGQTVTHYAPFMSDQDMSAMQWLKDHSKVDDTIFSPPTFALFAPAFTGHQVYYGHWSETPDYTKKLNIWLSSVNLSMTFDSRLDRVCETGSKYLVSNPALIDIPSVHKNGNTVVYHLGK